MQNVTLSCLEARAKIKHKLFSEFVCQQNYCRGMIEDRNKLWKILKEIGIPDHLILRLKINADPSGIAKMFVPTAANDKVSELFSCSFSLSFLKLQIVQLG